MTLRSDCQQLTVFRYFASSWRYEKKPEEAPPQGEALHAAASPFKACATVSSSFSWMVLISSRT